MAHTLHRKFIKPVFICSLDFNKFLIFGKSWFFIYFFSLQIGLELLTRSSNKDFQCFYCFIKTYEFLEEVPTNIPNGFNVLLKKIVRTNT